jgi:3-methyladenine DNA glycosylase AlkC
MTGICWLPFRTWREMSAIMSDSLALKDYINQDAVRRLGEQIRCVMSGFALDRFVRAGCLGLEPLEFTQRTRHVARALREELPEDTSSALRIVTECLPEPLPRSDGMFSENFWLWPLSDFVREFGVDAWDESIAACYRLTQCFTAEFAIRPQLERHPDRTLEVLQQWVTDESEHVRRLCSEGTRPRLPWASRLQLPRDRVLPILEGLNRDSSPFVRKSVANHLNDLGKDDPAWLLTTTKSWSQAAHPATDWIVRHALRSLIKQGDAGALSIIGYGSAKLQNVSLNVTPAQAAIGESVTARLRVTPSGRKSQSLLIDWVMYYARPSGRTSAKVFKGKEVKLAAGETFEWDKSFAMIPRSTRTLHAGPHRVEVQINGQIVASADFRLQ